MEIFGIQGGKGSFNEQALADYTQRHGINDCEISYLYTSENVLRALDKGDIDYGQFAVYNSVGGILEESLYAMSKYVFSVKELFGIPIQHFLMALPGTSIDEIRSIVTHPQVLKQCKRTLEQKYPSIHLTSGEGDMIDHAKVAEKMSTGDWDASIAVMGPKILSELYKLDILDENLQDDKTNTTYFVIVNKEYL